MIPYIELSDGALSITLISGPITINRNSINYRPILRGLRNGSLTEEELQKLRSVSLPDGIYYAYEISDKLLIKQITPDGITKWSVPTNEPLEIPQFPADHSGAYPSKQDLIADFPEYFI